VEAIAVTGELTTLSGEYIDMIFRTSEGWSPTPNIPPSLSLADRDQVAHSCQIYFATSFRHQPGKVRGITMVTISASSLLPGNRAVTASLWR